MKGEKYKMVKLVVFPLSHGFTHGQIQDNASVFQLVFLSSESNMFNVRFDLDSVDNRLPSGIVTQLTLIFVSHSLEIKATI